AKLNRTCWRLVPDTVMPKYCICPEVPVTFTSALAPAGAPRYRPLAPASWAADTAKTSRDGSVPARVRLPEVFVVGPFGGSGASGAGKGVSSGGGGGKSPGVPWGGVPWGRPTFVSAAVPPVTTLPLNTWPWL